MTTLQLAIAAGCTAGLGLAVILWQLAPGQPDLATALARLAPDRTTPRATVSAGQQRWSDRLGLWVQRHAPATAWGAVPTRELAILNMPVHRWYAEKALFALVGLLLPTVFAVGAWALGFTVPVPIPAGAGLLLAVGLSFLPDYNARDDARKAREEFARALGAYVDLVALERAGGAGTTQALESAAELGDSWVFVRLREELARARLTGQPPWDALTTLADELGLTELADLADIMRLGGEEGAAVYATLRARSAGLRTALLSAEHAKANATGEKMTLPVSALAIVFLVLIATPAVLRTLFTA